MSNLAKILSLSYDSAVAKKTSALKSYYRSVRLIKDYGVTVPTADSKYTNILLCGNCVDPETRNLYVFYIDILYHAAWIIEINIDNRVQTVVYYDKYNNIGFDPLHKIYNPRVVYGRIIWTDNVNPIYQMDVARAKRSFALGIGYGQNEVMTEWTASVSYATGRIVSNGNNFYKALSYNSGVEPRLDSGTVWQKLCLIEDAYYSMNVKNFYFEPVPPTHPPEVTYQSNDTRKINNLRQTLFQVAYRYVYMDWRKSTYSPASIVPVPQAEEETATGLANEQVSLNNKLQIVFNSGGEEVRAVEIIGRSSQDPSKWFLIDTISKFDIQERNNEISKVSYPVSIQLGIAVMQPLSFTGGGVSPTQLGMGLSIPIPVVYNSYVAVSIGGMGWDADQFVDSDAVYTEITCPLGTCSIQSKPDWINAVDGGGYPISIGTAITNGESIGFYPNTENTGGSRDGYVVLVNNYGDRVSIFVSQAAVAAPPVGVPITVSILKYSGDISPMAILGSSASALSEDNHVTWSASIAGLVGSTIYWRAYKQGSGILQGSGNFAAHNGSNFGTLAFNNNFIASDVITIYFSALTF